MLLMKKIDNINYPAPKQEYKVLVRCFTFNQSKYIEETLNGFAMQQTNFPFACLVMDDASTDGEQEVIKAWIERECDMSRAETIEISTSIVIVVPHKTNASCTFALYLLKQNLYYNDDKKMDYVYPWREVSRYEAICEGDDWWTDSTKLQKQVDFLDAHPEYLMCSTSYSSVRMKDGYINKGGEPGSGRDITFRQLMKKNTVGTLTVMYRLDVFVKYQNEVLSLRPKFMMGDLPLWLYIASQGKIRELPFDMANYRVLERSASHYDDFDRQYKFFIEGSRIRLWMNRFVGTHYSFYIWVRLLIGTRHFCRRWAKTHNESRITLWRKALSHLKSRMAIAL